MAQSPAKDQSIEPHVVKELAELIEANGGIQKTFGTTHFVDKLLKQREKDKDNPFGCRGSELRVAIRNKVSYWQRLHKNGNYIERVLNKLRVKSFNNRRVEADTARRNVTSAQWKKTKTPPPPAHSSSSSSSSSSSEDDNPQVTSSNRSCRHNSADQQQQQQQQKPDFPPIETLSINNMTSNSNGAATASMLGGKRKSFSIFNQGQDPTRANSLTFFFSCHSLCSSRAHSSKNLRLPRR